MKKWMFLIFVIGATLGGAAGFAVGIFVFPYIFLADTVATDQVPDAETRQTVAIGGFIHANPSDPVHWGRGKVVVYDDLVHLADDFEVGPGPKYKVYLVNAKNIKTSDDVKDAEFVDLGPIKAFKGSQNYAVAPDVDLSSYGSVVIWCEAFGVLISPATLAFAAQ